MSELFLHPIASGKSISDIYRTAFAEASELYDASTAASDLHMIISGWLNGVQLATTPIGVRKVYFR